MCNKILKYDPLHNGKLQWGLVMPAGAEFKILVMNHGPKGGAAVIAQSPEVKTTKRTLPQFHGKQVSTKLHSHNTPTICL